MKKVIHTLTLILCCAFANASDGVRNTIPSPAVVEGEQPAVLVSSPDQPEEADSAATEANCDGYMIIYNRNQQLCKKGTFRRCTLVDGQEYVYDSAGSLVQIKVYANGKYVGDAALPERK